MEKHNHFSERRCFDTKHTVLQAWFIKRPRPLPNGRGRGSHFYLALQPLRESRDAAGGGDHADAGTVRLGRPILPSSLYLGIALIIGYLWYIRYIIFCPGSQTHFLPECVELSSKSVCFTPKGAIFRSGIVSGFPPSLSGRLRTDLSG